MNRLLPIGIQDFRTLLDGLHTLTGRTVVVLVDEYDKPILDVFDNPELARANRDYLRGVYGIIKDAARHVRFVFVTGVSMFSKVSLSSGLNNLRDISLDPRYSSLEGSIGRIQCSAVPQPIISAVAEPRMMLAVRSSKHTGRSLVITQMRGERRGVDGYDQRNSFGPVTPPSGRR